MSRFIAVDRETAYLLPPSVDEWLPQDHLARFMVEVIDQLDLSELVRQYAGRGSDAYHPAMLLGLLVYGYATGGAFEPQDRAGLPRLGGVSLHCRQHAA